MPREVTVSIGSTPFKVETVIGPHQLTADEPGDFGGGDTGPAPTSLLPASVATCKVITAKMYADRKGWPLDRLDATAHAAEVSGHVITRIEVELTASGDLDEEQRRRLLDIADRCPVQKAIAAGIDVHSCLAGA